jgi:hypothetical protein
MYDNLLYVVGCCSNVNRSLDGCLTEELKRVNLPQEGSIVDDSKKPSRSARRKKAKRMWLREQAKVNPLLSDLFWCTIASDWSCIFRAVLFPFLHNCDE